MTDMEKQIRDCENLLAQGYSAAEMRWIGFADRAIREAILRAIQEDHEDG